MPSACRSGLISLSRSCDRKPTKPIAAPTTRIARKVKAVARKKPRFARTGAFGDLSSDCEIIVMADNPLPGPTLEAFGAKWSLEPFPPRLNRRERALVGARLRSLLASLDVVKGRKQRPSRGRGGDRRDHQRLHGQHQ